MVTKYNGHVENQLRGHGNCVVVVTEEVNLIKSKTIVFLINYFHISTHCNHACFLLLLLLLFKMLMEQFLLLICSTVSLACDKSHHH